MYTRATSNQTNGDEAGEQTAHDIHNHECSGFPTCEGFFSFFLEIF
jgi:hypothetical protein